MPTLKTYDLFISHAWKYGAEYDRLKNLLDNAPYFYYRNYSAPKDRPLHNLDSTDAHTKRQITDAITRKIQHVNAVIVLSGMYFPYHEWMEIELEIAKKYNRPIIAVLPYGSTLIPTYIQLYATEIVGWNTNSIVNAIRTNAI